MTKPRFTQNTLKEETAHQPGVEYRMTEDQFTLMLKLFEPVEYGAVLARLAAEVGERDQVCGMGNRRRP